MIVRLRHVVACEHEQQPVVQAAHVLRLRPRSLAWQRVLRFALAVDPRPSKQRDGADHFGNPITWIFHDAPHARFEVASDMVVELLPRPALAAAATPSWEQVADDLRNKAWAWREAEFAFPSPLAPPLPEARAFATSSFPPARPVADGVACLARRIGRQFAILPSAASSVALARTLEGRAGSRRDLVHVMIAGLRSLGLSARAISGYVPEASPPGARLHAWVSCWLGPDLRWLDLDPAEGAAVGAERICLGWGRDLGDFSPVRGVLSGAHPHGPQLSTRLERLEAEVSQ
jgi:transglutaminase-like putative cysteine protease